MHGRVIHVARFGDGTRVASRIVATAAPSDNSCAMPLRLSSILAALALAAAPAAQAAGGHYSFDGGTRAERAQVRAALNASSFDWNVVPGPIVVHIAPNLVSSAAPNAIWLDARLLDSGRFSWGVVQHEYAHLVDFGVLTDAMREQLAPVLGGTSWWGAGHDDLDGERFADYVAWAYWPSADNTLRPSVARTATVFRATLSSLLQARTLQRVTATTTPRG